MELIVWLYMINATLLISHEIDSAYWQEWKLFRIPGGIRVFVLLHLPLVFIILYGLLQLYLQTFTGLIISLLLCLSGMFAFGIHLFFIRKGHDEFKTVVSLLVLVATLLISIAQFAVTVYTLAV